MSAEKKLYNLEVNPPQQVWDKLAVSLDELQVENTFKKKLLGVNANPPEGVWEKIENKLEIDISEERVATKLLNISETPPAEIWSQIESQLTEETFNQKFSRLKNLEVIPPENNWSKILTALETKTKVVPFRKTSKQFIRYAAAAVIIGMLAWGSVQLMSGNRTAENNLAKEEAKSPATKSIPEVTNNPPSENSNTESTQTLENSEEIIASNNTTTKTKIRRTKASNNVSVASVTVPQTSHANSEEIIADINSIQKNKPAETGNVAADPTSPRYLVYLNDEGELMKVSKKLADMKCLYDKNGEISQDALASINNKACNDLVKSWQEKLSKTPMNLSFNPLEMADILK
ncbi:MAG: hypothetical protein E6H07_11515 [Bacteroidetes bacterium]|nr:MAG: hypothetical protein E6H07_11515 [Bacteroidota bacterium]